VEFLTAFKWICLALFAASAVIWLLDMVGVLTIRTPAQRKIFNAALGTTLIGGMAGFAVTAFFTPPEPDPKPQPNPTPSVQPAGPASPSPSPTSSPSSRPLVPPPPQVSADPAPSEPVRVFLSANNLARPMIDPQWDAGYPRCARQARTNALPAPDARRCFRELDEFNAAVLRPYQDTYEAYVPRVAELSFSQPSGEILDFLRAEASGFTNGTHQTATLYRTISTELYDDYARLRQLAYR